MIKIRPISFVMALILLITMLPSCSSVKKGSNVVKADDPWYESTRFKLEKDIRQYEEEGVSAVFTSNDRCYSLYCVSKDRWGSSRTVLDTYDFDGNMLSRQYVKCQDGCYIMHIYSAVADPEGKSIRVIVYYNSITADGRAVFANIDPETGELSDIKDLISDEAKMAVKKNSSLFDVVSTGDYNIVVMLDDYKGGMVFNWQLLVFKDGEYITQLDMTGINLRVILGLTVNEASGSVFLSGYEESNLITMEFDIGTGKVKSKDTFHESEGDSINFSEYAQTCNGELCKIDSYGNITKIDVSTMTEKTVVDTNWYTPFFLPDPTEKKSKGVSILSCTEDRVVLHESEGALYGIMESVSSEYIRVLNKADKNPHAGKQIIELALPLNTGVSDYLARNIYEFNKTDDEYIIRVWDKYKTGYNMMRTMMGTIDEDDEKVYQMIQDLRGDDAPDLAIGIQKNYAMRDDVFMDLSDFLEPGVSEKQYNNIIEAGRIDGKLYFLPVTLQIEGLVTDTSYLKDGAVGITFDEYDKLIEDSMYGYSPYDYPDSTAYNKLSFILSCIDTKSAIEGDSVEFGTEQFRTAAQYAKDNFQYDDISSVTTEYIHDTNRNRGGCYYAKIDYYLDFVHACYNSNDNFRIIGTPSVDASGPRFKALETISVSATTDVEEGCKKFINYLFSGAAFDSTECDFWQIVTNKEIMEKNIDSLTGINNEIYETFVQNKKSGVYMQTYAAEKASGDKFATDEMRESFLNSLSTISTYYYEDHVITDFVVEELAPYYAGDRSLDDAIRYLDDRTAKYVREM